MIKKDTKYFTFHQYNSPFEDIHLLVKDKRHAQNILIDCGDISHIPKKELLRVKHIFISHFHMDHFIGFSSLIRIFLTAPSNTTLHIYGPNGLIKKICATIESFTWNLLDETSFKLSLTEITEREWITLPPTTFHKIPESLEQIRKLPLSPILYENESLQVQYIFLEHKIPVLGYKIIQNPEVYFIRENCPFPPAPWIKDIKKLLLEKNTAEVEIEVSPKCFIKSSDLIGYFKIQEAISFLYLTDFLYSANKQEILDFANCAEILFIENHFLPQDQDLALATYHLSSLDVKDIIKKTQPKDFVLSHFSRRYMGEYQYKDFLQLLIE